MAHLLNIKNRDEYHTFVPTPVARYGSKYRIKSVRAVRISPDEEYRKLKEKGLQIDISNPDILVNGKKPIDGIFSPLFGADTTQDSPIFACDCHKLIGGENLGRICLECGTECRPIEADLRLCGHVDIAPYHILTFHGYNAFSRLFDSKKKSKNMMTEIITTTRKISRSGKVVKGDLPTIMELYYDYEKEYRDLIGLDKEIVFMSKIPVYSSRLRPLITYSATMNTILDVNKKYLSIVNLAGVLRSSQVISFGNREIETQRVLNQLQQDWNEVCDIILSQINGKTGVFRHALASGRLDNSSRLVITAGIDLMPHEIDLPYQTMMVQYEEEICNYLQRLQDIPLSKAITMVEEHTNIPDPLFVNIINQILKSGVGVWGFVNRNPTISKYGIGYMRVRKIHEDFTDLTMHLPPDPLGNYAADYDGDQVTFVANKNPMYHQFFMPLCPSYAFVDRTDGKFNRSMGFEKDYAALLAAAWDIDTAYDAYLMCPDEDSDKLIREMGLDDLSSEDQKEAREKALDLLAKSNLKGSFAERFVDPFGQKHG